MARSKSSLLIDSPIMSIQLTTATFVDTTNWLATQLISIVNPIIFRITGRCNSVKV